MKINIFNKTQSCNPPRLKSWRMNLTAILVLLLSLSLWGCGGDGGNGGAGGPFGYGKSTDNPNVAVKNAARRFLPHLRNQGWMSDVFGSSYNRQTAEMLADRIEQEGFSWLPLVTAFSPKNTGAYIEGHKIYDRATEYPHPIMGAYKNNRIFWSTALVGKNADERIADVIAVQELAHHIDSLVNPGGPLIGGEGVLAAAKIFGPNLSRAQIAGLRTYRDHADIFVNNNVIRDVELGFWKWVKIGGFVSVSVVAIVMTGGIGAPEVLALDAAAAEGAALTAEGLAEGAAAAEAAVTESGAVAEGVEAESVVTQRSGGLLKRSTRHWGGLNDLANLGESVTKSFSSGLTRVEINETEMLARAGSGGGEAAQQSMFEYAVEQAGDGHFSQAFAKVEQSPSLREIVKQMGSKYGFNTPWR